MCAECPVRSTCLEHALAAGEPFGIWGGLTLRERRVLRRARAAQPRTRLLPSLPADHAASASRRRPTISARWLRTVRTLTRSSRAASRQLIAAQQRGDQIGIPGAQLIGAHAAQHRRRSAPSGSSAQLVVFARPRPSLDGSTSSCTSRRRRPRTNAWCSIALRNDEATKSRRAPRAVRRGSPSTPPRAARRCAPGARPRARAPPGDRAEPGQQALQHDAAGAVVGPAAPPPPARPAPGHRAPARAPDPPPAPSAGGTSAVGGGPGGAHARGAEHVGERRPGDDAGQLPRRRPVRPAADRPPGGPTPVCRRLRVKRQDGERRAAGR